MKRSESMKKKPKEKLRVQTLREYNVLDSAPMDHFDEITKTAALIFDCEIALINLVDENRQWFLSKKGINLSEMPRIGSFCEKTVSAGEFCYIEDASKDKDHSSNPVHLGPLNVHFYAGHPLSAPNGENIGSLCIMDARPKTLSQNQKKLLGTLANQVMSYLELHKKNEELRLSEERREALINNMIEGVVVQDKDRKIIEYNQSALRILGLTKEQLLGANSMDPQWEITKKDGAPFPMDERPANLCFKTQRPVRNIVMGVKSPHSELRWLVANATPSWTNNGLQVVATFQDITELFHRKLEFHSYAKAVDEHAIVAKTDKSGLITYVNKKFCEISEYTEEELLGKNHRLLNSGHHSRKFFSNMWRTLNSGKVWKGEIFNRSKTGKHYWVDTTISPLFNYKGEITEFMAIRYDITQRKLAEIEISHSHRSMELALERNESSLSFLRSIQNNAGHAIISTSKTGIITSFNRKAQELLGVKEEEVVGKLSICVFHKIDELLKRKEKFEKEFKLKIPSAFETIIAPSINGLKNEFEWTYQDRFGKQFPVNISVTTKIDPCESNSGFLFIAQDLSDKKRIEKELKDTNQFLDFALEGAGLGAWEWDLENDRVKFDERWGRIIGIGLEDLKMERSTWKTRVHYEDEEKCYEDLKAYIDGKTECFENIHRLKHEDGHWVYILTRGRFSEWDENGRPVRITGTHLDITKTKVANEEKLAEFKEILSANPSCLKIVDKNGHFIDINPQGLFLFGAKSQDDLRDITIHSLVKEEHKKAYAEFNRSVCEGNKESLIFEIESLDGQSRWVESYAAPYTLPNGETAHIGIANDISDRVAAQAEYERQKSISQHHSKLASIGELAAGVGHEINNPLTIIKGYMAVIEKATSHQTPLDMETLKENISKVNLATDRIAKIVGGLRTFSRSDSNELTKFGVTEAINESCNMVMEIYHQEGVELFNNTELTSDILIEGSRGQFQQILMNLISNAKDATVESATREIHINSWRTEQSAFISIRDTGKGISSELKEKIFDPFFTTKEVNLGTGIGLSIVHSLVKQMKGSLKLDSAPGEGANFIIELPFLEANAQVPAVLYNNKPAQTTNFAGIKVLLADDEEGVRELLADNLEAMGMEVTAVENGKLALEEYSKAPRNFDIIISDIKMPVLDGISLLKELHKIGMPHSKFLFITGGVNYNFEDPTDDINILIDGHLFKPFNEEDIIETLSEVLFKNKGLAA